MKLGSSLIVSHFVKDMMANGILYVQILFVSSSLESVNCGSSCQGTIVVIGFFDS